MTLKQTELAVEQLIAEVEILRSRMKAIEDTLIYWPMPKKGDDRIERRNDGGSNAEES